MQEALELYCHIRSSLSMSAVVITIIIITIIRQGESAVIVRSWKEAFSHWHPGQCTTENKYGCRDYPVILTAWTILGIFFQLSSHPIESDFENPFLGVPGEAGTSHCPIVDRTWIFGCQASPHNSIGLPQEETYQADFRFLQAWFVCGLDFNFF